jgi:putative polyhydroxyalkanoic acid system protein
MQARGEVMPRLTVEVDHSLERDEAQRRLKAFVTGLLTRFGGQVSDVRQQWSGTELDFGFKLYGASLDGTLSVEQTCARCDLSFPLAAMAFKGKAEDTIRGELERVLGQG